MTYPASLSDETIAQHYQYIIDELIKHPEQAARNLKLKSSLFEHYQNSRQLEACYRCLPVDAQEEIKAFFNRANQENLSVKAGDSVPLHASSGRTVYSDLSSIHKRKISPLPDSEQSRFTTETLDINSEEYRDLIVSSLELEDVVKKDSVMEFSWDADRNTPKGMHYQSTDYEKFLSHSALRFVIKKISRFIFEEMINVNPAKLSNSQLKCNAKKLHKFPPASSFSIKIDSKAKRARLYLLSNPAANQRILNGKVSGEMPVAFAKLTDSSRSQLIIPAGMYQCVLSSLRHPDAARFLSTAGLIDCTALILYDRKNKIATLTHFWTQTITGSNIRRQFDLMIEEGALSSSVEAKVVGGSRSNLWSDSGFFNCIEPALISLGIPVTETNVGANRPQNILFDLQTGNLYHLQSDCSDPDPDSDPLGSMSLKNKKTARILDWSPQRQYYFSDHTNSELLVSADISLQKNA